MRLERGSPLFPLLYFRVSMALVNRYSDEHIIEERLPGGCGCIDGTHIPMKAPTENQNDYISPVSKPNLWVSIKNIVMKFYTKYK